MNKNSYLIIEIMDKSTGKTAASVRKWHHSNNLTVLFKNTGGYEILSVNIADSKKEAESIAAYWNEAYISNNKYLYA